MPVDFSELYFTLADEVSGIPHWRQNFNTTSSTVWVKVSSIPIGGTTIYLYYNGCGSSGSPDTLFDYFNDFTSLSGVQDYGTGDTSIETYNTYSVIRKENRCDPNGAFIPLGFIFDDYLLITRETRPNDGSSNNGCSLNRYGVENSQYRGYNISRNGHQGNDFGVERRRNAGGGNFVSVALSPVVTRDTFVISELSRCSSSNTNKAELFDDQGQILATVTSSLSNHNYDNFDRLTIRGGHDYLIDYMALAKYTCNPPSYSLGAVEVASSDQNGCCPGDCAIFPYSG